MKGGCVMKYKLLLTGKNKTVIDDIFGQLNENLEPLTTSIRYEDIISHLKYVGPDAFVYCIYNETRDHINRMISLKTRMENAGIPFIVVGSEEDCAEFEQITTSTADLILASPLKAAVIESKIITFIEERRRQAAEELRIQEEQRIAAELEAEKNRRKHILAVDDDATMLKTLKEHLHDDYDVATAISGKVALKFLEKKKTDLILLDYAMPGESGTEILEQLRENENTKDIPVIFLTGVTERDKIREALVLKPQGYLLKPIEHDKLLAAIDKIFG